MVVGAARAHIAEHGRTLWQDHNRSPTLQGWEHMAPKDDLANGGPLRRPAFGRKPCQTLLFRALLRKLLTGCFNMWPLPRKRALLRDTRERVRIENGSSKPIPTACSRFGGRAGEAKGG